MSSEPREFGDLLRRYRVAAGLTQAALAQRAGLSARGISDLERALRRSPHPETVRRIGDALDLEREERAALAALAVSAAEIQTPSRPESAAYDGSSSTSVPMQLSSFIGREAEIEELADLAASTRLLTLTGPGGIGKTRLAVEVSRRVLEEFTGGFCLVELASLSDARLVPQAVASALGIAEQPRRPLLEVMTDRLQSRALLLVLDNCEHLVDSCAELVQVLLENCRWVHIFATSRERLGVAGETTWRVPPLGLPEHRNEVAADLVGQSEAARLFTLRAAAVLPTFSLEPNAAGVARICWQVDGMPLALELAAAWVRVLSVEEIADRLDDALGFLSTGGRRIPARQRTLRATFEWSYALLPEPERALFARLSVFVGGFTLEACEAVCRDGRQMDPRASANLDGHRLLELLGGLIDRSFVLAEPAANGTRYRMLEPLRQFALELLMQDQAAATMRQRHASWFLAIATDAARRYHGPGELEAFERLEREHANLQAAFDNLLELRDADAAAALVFALWWFWISRDHWQEARNSPERLLDGSEFHMGPARHAEMLSLAAVIAWLQGDFPTARTWVEQGLAVARQQVEPEPLATLLTVAGQLAVSDGEYTTARQRFNEGLPLARAAGDYWNHTRTLDGLARLALAEDDLAESSRLLESCLGLARDVGDDWTVATVSNVLGDVARRQGDYLRARARYEESLDRFASLGSLGQRPSLLHNLGYVALHEQELARAAVLFCDSLRLFSQMGERRGVAECLVGLGSVAGAAGRPEQAARLFGAADAAFGALGTQLSASNRADHSRHVALARAGLREGAYATAYTAGQQLSLEVAVDEALGLETFDHLRGRIQGKPGPLTSRERQVAELVKQGLTNRQIGESLVITEGTAGLHVKNALAKLGFRSRAQLAAWATEHTELSTV